ncbi:CRISPR-associated helicase Cas3' [Methylomonas paludis]|uniref:CRISPR-associated helicase Cas3 n=1 Tax=Methylomonas paludis TaxID=1173101 RepID=A0A975MMM1_9GAMM|nr:CRISPR-associated helicase Cas3' [Methylomonas paludis]QWF70615.1 CRISPR-associated helicase Cas3' [Methylomonas paludis]
MTHTPQYYRYWGKAKAEPEAGQPAYHLLPYHCLDVAAVGWVLLERNPYLLNHFANLCGIEKQVLKPVLIFFLALHDLGKFSESFQNIIPELLEKLQGIKNSKKQAYSKKVFAHDSMGFLIWKESVFKQVIEHYHVDNAQDWRDLLNWIMEASNGHHGLPIKQGNEYLGNFYNENNKQAVAQYTKECLEIFSITDLFDNTDLNVNYDILYQQLPKLSWVLTGFFVLCDWIGSGKKFKYNNDPNIKLKAYWDDIALKTAEEAISEAGILPCQINVELEPLSQLLDLPDFAELTPLQNLAKEIDIQQAPQLFIIEDETGAGKTEASLILLNRLMAKGLAQGFYIALPTMATADGIYPRVQKTYDKLYKEGEKPSLVLSHSSAKLSDKFTDTILYFDKNATGQKYSDDAQSRCLAWLADNRKKSLLAHVGVGTIDQTFLAVLKVKYQSLRLIGLLGKVLVIDEAHAYDAYMGKELEVLLEVHAALGGSAIVMSATLPLKIREKLANAFLKGLERNGCRLEEQNAYPLLTHIAADYKNEIPCQNNPKRRQKPTNYQFIHDEQQINQLIKVSLERGQCVCWIRNSIKDARNTFLYWQARHDKTDLFHARFVLSDRLAIQEKILLAFDKKSTGEQRKGRLLIATQVVEQSLDLDFDVMITDLASIDLMLQRAGRLHRHIRDQYGNFKSTGEDERPDAMLTIFCPENTDTPSADWYSAKFPNSKKVYQNHARLWLGQKELAKLKLHQIPKNIRPLIEAVYGDKFPMPKGLETTDTKAIGDANAERSHAGFNTINFDMGYTMAGQVWAEDLDMPTRLGDETIMLTLAKWEDGQLHPFGKPDKHAWQKSEIRVLAKNISELLPLSEAQQQAFDVVKNQLPSQGKWLNLLPMLWNAEKGLWQGVVINHKKQETPIFYHPQLGLIYAYEIEQVQQDEQLETEEIL